MAGDITTGNDADKIRVASSGQSNELYPSVSDQRLILTGGSFQSSATLGLLLVDMYTSCSSLALPDSHST